MLWGARAAKAKSKLNAVNNERFYERAKSALRG